MALTAAVSVASFSVVLAETFAAIGASTLVPATFVSGLRMAKGTGDGESDGGAALGDDKMLAGLGTNPLKPVIDILGKNMANVDEVQLLLPRDAKLHAEFEFEARDSVSVEVGASGSLPSVQVVSVNAGFAALYESRSKNKITLDMNFVAVNIAL